MERAFIVTKESDYYKALERFREAERKQIELMDRFFKNKNIEANEYILSGNGKVNEPFIEKDMNSIKLGIKPSKNDFERFKGDLCKTYKYGLLYFRKNSRFMKEVQQFCIDNEVIGNLCQPSLRYMFKTRLYGTISSKRIPYEEGIYLKIECDTAITDEDVPIGVIPIKLSEFYKYQEEYEEREGKQHGE